METNEYDLSVSQSFGDKDKHIYANQATIIWLIKGDLLDDGLYFWDWLWFYRYNENVEPGGRLKGPPVTFYRSRNTFMCIFLTEF